MMSDGTAAVLVAFKSLEIAAGTTLNVTGDKPLILAVAGDVTISGTIDASAKGQTAGPGGNVSCQMGAGADGVDDTGVNTGAGGGGGGGFGTAGGKGGKGDTQQPWGSAERRAP